MKDDLTSQFTRLALHKVDAFIAEHPGYTCDGVSQPEQGATNRVVFGRRGDDLVVFKVFCEAERKERECFGLHHWRETGFVPKLIWDADSTMIVMSHIPGVFLSTVRKVDGEIIWREACRENGRALGLLASVSLGTAGRASFESRFYKGLGSLEAYLGRILELGWSIHTKDTDFRGGFWGDSLNFINAQLKGILSQPRILYHQDAGNFHVQQGNFMGFFDLEMCRVGCVAMQLASSPAVFDGDEENWESFRKGWEAATGKLLGPDDLKAAAAGQQLLCWRVICRYMSYDGTPGTGYAWATPADPVEYRMRIESAQRMLGVK